METYSYNNRTENRKLAEAQKQVKRMKGFYIHAIVFVCVNLIIIAGNLYESSGNIVRFDTYATALFWGIGLFGHGLAVFGGDFFFGKDWEQKKIQEILNR